MFMFFNKRRSALSPDPLPEARLQASIAKKKEREQRDADSREQRQRQAETDAANIEKRRSEKIWALGGFYMEQTSGADYTLAELEAWAASYGCVFGGDLGGFPQGFDAVCPALGLSVILYRFYDSNGGRKFNFAKAAAHLREWVSERRLRQNDVKATLPQEFKA